MFKFKSLLRFLSVWLGVVAILSINSAAAFAAEKLAPAGSKQGPEIFVQLGHSADVNSLSFSPDGHYLVSAGKDKTVNLWDMATGREVRTFRNEKDGGSAAFSPNGRHILSGDYDGNMRLWDIKTGKTIMSLAHPTMVCTVAFSPDGKYALSAGGNALVYWDIKKGEWIFKVEDTGIYVWDATFSKDGKYIVMGIEKYGGTPENTINILDVKKRKILKTFPGAEGKINAVAFSPDRKYIISGSGSNYKDGNLRVLDAASGALLKVFPIPWPVKSVAFSPDGEYAAAGTGGEVAVFEVATWEKKRMIKGGSPVVFSLDSRFLAYTNNLEYIHGIESYIFGIEIVNMASGERIRRLSKDAEQVRSAAFSSTGREIIAPGIRLSYWDMNIGKRTRAIFLKDPSGKAVILNAVSPDAKYAIEYYLDTGIRGIRLWDIATERMVHQFPKDGTSVNSMRFSHDGRYLLTGSWDGGLAIWDLYNRKKVKTFSGKHKKYVTFLAFSPDGKFAFSGSVDDDGTIKMWDVATGSEVKTFTEAKSVNSLDVSPNGKYLLSGGYSGGEFPVILWNIDTGLKVKTFKGHAYIVNTVAFSHDGKYALSGGFDHAIKLWDTIAGKEVRTFKGHSGLIESVGFSPDDERLISVSRDGTTRLWDISTGKEIAQFIGFTDGEWIVITPEGYYNSSANGDKHLNVRIGNNVYGIENYREAFFRPDLVKVALSGGSLKDFKTLADVKQPPVVLIVNTPESVNKDEATVTLNIVDSGGGIGDIRLYLNGSAVILDSSRGVKITPKDDKTVYKAYNLKLTNGLNTIRAIAFNGDNTMQSNDALHEITASFKSLTKPSLNAIIVGINEYKNPKLQLKYAVSDAELFEDTLKKVTAGLFEKVNIKKLVTKENTTSENIIKELKAYRALNPDDVFVFFVASHGTVDDGEYFLITSNVGSTRTEKLKTDALPQGMLKELIANIPATKKLIIIDTCSAGALGEAIQVAMLTRGMSEDTAMKILSRAVGSTILSASTSLQEAVEGYQGHGLFTYVLVEGLKGKADKGKTGYVKTTELADYVDSEVPVLAEKVFKKAQYPTISISGQAFPIGKTGK